MSEINVYAVSEEIIVVEMLAARGLPGLDATATTDASELISGTLPDARLSSNVVLEAELAAAIAGVTINITSPDGSILIITTPGGEGGSGGSLELVVGETPTGLVNGSNATYTTAFSLVPESVELFINGVRQTRITHFTTSGTTTVLITDSPLTGDFLQLNYQKA